MVESPLSSAWTEVGRSEGQTGTVAVSMWDSGAQQLRVQEASAAPGRGGRPGGYCSQ